MTVAELIAELRKYSPETQVSLSTRHGEADEFTVEEADDGWIVLED